MLEVALGEKQRLLTMIDRKREDAMGQDLARRLQEEEWAAADAAAAAVSRRDSSNPAHTDGDAELAAAIALSLGDGYSGTNVATSNVDLRSAQDQEYAEALAQDLQRQSEVVRANTASGDDELRLMRERRAKAAEARLKHQQAQPMVCSECDSMLGGERFSRDEKIFCSTACVRLYASRQ